MTLNDLSNPVRNPARDFICPAGYQGPGCLMFPSTFPNLLVNEITYFPWIPER